MLHCGLACTARIRALAFMTDFVALRNDSTRLAYSQIDQSAAQKQGPDQKGGPMSATAQTLRPPSRTLMFMEGRAIHEFGAFLGALPLLSLAPRGDGHPVLVLPGLVASDLSTRPLRAFLNNRGYKVSGWGQGRNLGLRDGVKDSMVDLVRELSDRSGRKISLVGWSLGGLYARQLAKMMPDRVRAVITL